MRGSESIVVDYKFNESPSEIWRALTDSNLLSQWLMPNDIVPVDGHRFTFRAKPPEGADWDGIVHCEITEVDPPHKLAYIWQGGKGAGDPEFPRLDTIVTWTLRPRRRHSAAPRP